MRHPLLPLLVLTICVCGLASAGLIQDENTLKAKLLKGYNRNTLPTNSRDQTFIVHVHVGLLDLGDLDEVDEKLTTTIAFYMKWTDESMVWNKSDHNDIRRIAMHQSDVWLPLLSVRNLHHTSNRAAKDKDIDKVTYKSDGSAEFFHSETIQSTCDLDTTNFPFDRQTCYIRLALSGYLEDNVGLKTNRDLQQNLNKDGAWDIVYAHAQETLDRPEMIIRFDFVRKPLFMLINILMPTIVLALLTPLVFILPSDSGDRVGFSITTLLAISVYMTIIGDNLPANSDPMPLVTIMLFVWYVLTSSIIFVVIINIKIYSWAGKRPVPEAARRFVHFVNISWICRSALTAQVTQDETKACLGDNDNANNANVTSDDPEVASSRKIERAVNRKPQKQQNITWKHVTYAIDRFFMVVIYTVMILFASLFLIILKYKQVQQTHDIDTLVANDD